MRGTTGSSLILYLLGVTAGKPLPPHYYCPQCHGVIWRSDCKDGFDLPLACCEKDGVLLRGDGHDIPWQTHWWYGREQAYEFDVPDTLLEPLGEFFHGHWLAKLRPGAGFACRHTGPVDSPQLMEFSNLWINCILDPGEISPDFYDIAPDADCIPNAAKLLRSLLDAIDGLDDALRSCSANTFADIVAKYGLASSIGVWDEDAGLMVERLGFALSNLITYSLGNFLCGGFSCLGIAQPLGNIGLDFGHIGPGIIGYVKFTHR